MGLPTPLTRALPSRWLQCTTGRSITGLLQPARSVPGLRVVGTQAGACGGHWRCTGVTSRPTFHVIPVNSSREIGLRPALSAAQQGALALTSLGQSPALSHPFASRVPRAPRWTDGTCVGPAEPSLLHAGRQRNSARSSCPCVQRHTNGSVLMWPPHTVSLVRQRTDGQTGRAHATGRTHVVDACLRGRHMCPPHVAGVCPTHTTSPVQ